MVIKLNNLNVYSEIEKGREREEGKKNWTRVHIYTNSRESNESIYLNDALENCQLSKIISTLLLLFIVFVFFNIHLLLLLVLLSLLLLVNYCIDKMLYICTEQKHVWWNNTMIVLWRTKWLMDSINGISCHESKVKRVRYIMKQ